MRFARVVFVAAGIWGIAFLIPLYFLLDETGPHYASPPMYVQFFYGYFSVAMAWQIAFLVIASNPPRFRPLMVPSIVEKFSFVMAVAVLYSQTRISATGVTAAVPELLLGVLFTLAFAKTRASTRPGVWVTLDLVDVREQPAPAGSPQCLMGDDFAPSTQRRGAIR